MIMLTGNVPSVQKALAKANIDIAQVDLFEVNESFAAIPIHFQKSLGLNEEKINCSGSAIALGHPLGATGGILLGTLIDNLERIDGRIGVVSICGGAGIASSMVIERL